MAHLANLGGWFFFLLHINHCSQSQSQPRMTHHHSHLTTRGTYWMCECEGGGLLRVLPLSPKLIHRRFGISKTQICMVGDRLDTDIVFGQNGGCKTLLVLSGASDTHKECFQVWHALHDAMIACASLSRYEFLPYSPLPSRIISCMLLPLERG